MIKKFSLLMLTMSSSLCYAGYMMHVPLNHLTVTPPPTTSLSVNKQSLIFEDTTENQFSVAQSITLLNNGTLPVAYSGASFAQFGADYSTSTTCGSSIAAGTSCTVAVQFVPKAAGTFNDTLTINTGAGSYSVLLFGKGLSAFVPNLSLSMSEPSHDFGSMWQGDTSSAYRFTLTNTGNVNANVGAFSSLTNFTYSSTCPNSVLTPNQSCTIDIAARPTQSGLLIETLGVPTDDGNKAIEVRTTSVVKSYTYSLNDQASLSIPFGSIEVGKSSSASSIVIKNTGNVSQSLSGFGKTGTNASDFSYSVGNCGASLAAGASCTATATFTPLTAGTKSASLNFTMGPNAVSVGLTGSATTLNGIPAGATGFLLHLNGSYVDAISGAQPTIIGSPVSAASMANFGTAYQFNSGTSASMNYGTYSFGSGDFAIEFFVKPNSTSDWKWIVGNASSSSWTNGWMVYLNSAQKINMYLNNGSNLYLFNNALVPSIPTGSWSHIVITRNGTTCALFINGTRVTTTNDTGSYVGGYTGFNTAIASTNSLRVGSDGTTSFSAGSTIDELRLIKNGTPYSVGSTSITVPTAPYTP